MDVIRKNLRKNSLFQFDFYLKGLTSGQIQKRIISLVKMYQNKQDQKEDKKAEQQEMPEFNEISSKKDEKEKSVESPSKGKNVQIKLDQYFVTSKQEL